MINDNELVDEYLKLFREGYYKNKLFAPEEIRKELYRYKDKLPVESIELITKYMNASELFLICNPKHKIFDNTYCIHIEYLVLLLNQYRFNINSNIMEYIKECIRMQYGFERYMTESKEFRNYLYQLSMDNDMEKKDIRFVINHHLCAITAYAYYMSLGKDEIYNLSITFMCNYETIIDNLRVNGFRILNSNFTLNYIKVLIDIINKYNYKVCGREIK